MKVFISLPMRGRSDEEIANDIKRAKAIVRTKLPNATFVDNFIHEEVPEDTIRPATWYLGLSIQMLGECDAIFMVAGWPNAAGCRCEKAVAMEYGIHVMYEIGG